MIVSNIVIQLNLFAGTVTFQVTLMSFPECSHVKTVKGHHQSPMMIMIHQKIPWVTGSHNLNYLYKEDKYNKLKLQVEEGL